jgi:hypothetical protein
MKEGERPALVPQAKPGLVPVQHLDPVPILIAEHEQRGQKWRQLHLLFHDRHQPIDRLAEVHGIPVQGDRTWVDEHTHDRAFINSASHVGSVLAGKCNRLP